MYLFNLKKHPVCNVLRKAARNAVPRIVYNMYIVGNSLDITVL